MENVNNIMNQQGRQANIRDRRQARKNARDQLVIGFGFASDRLNG